jgi:hypothetical protein
VYWKFRLFLRFYSGKRGTKESGGLADNVKRGLSGLRGGQHDSKLQTAFRNAFRSALDTLRTQFKPGWISRREERELFANWDAVYREIRRQRLALGVSVPMPADTTELHKTNVIAGLRADHETSHSLPV